MLALVGQQFLQLLERERPKPRSDLRKGQLVVARQPARSRGGARCGGHGVTHPHLLLGGWLRAVELALGVLLTERALFQRPRVVIARSGGFGAAVSLPVAAGLVRRWLDILVKGRPARGLLDRRRVDSASSPLIASSVTCCCTRMDACST